MSITLKNPHSVLAVLENRPQDILELQVPTNKSSDAWAQVEAKAQELIAERTLEHSIMVRRPQPHRKSAKQGRAGTAGTAEVKPHRGADLTNLFHDAKSNKGVWLALDQLQDPHNVGAIFRAAAFFGIKGIVLTRERSAPISSVAYDVATGGVEHVPFSVESNLSRTIRLARDAGLWMLGTSEHAEKTLDEIPRDRAWMVVVGSEESGLRHLTLENCDEICSIPGGRAVSSLNVSVAAGIMMHALSD